MSNENLPSSLEVCPEPVWDLYLDAYRAGYVDGIAAGRKAEADELAAFQRAAAEVVWRAATMPPVDREVAQARRARIDARWPHQGRGCA